MSWERGLQRSDKRSICLIKLDKTAILSPLVVTAFLVNTYHHCPPWHKRPNAESPRARPCMWAPGVGGTQSTDMGDPC